MAQQPPWDVQDELWDEVRALLPVVQRRHRNPGRKRLDDRKALCGVLFVLCTGVRWDRLPQELGYGSGVTCWRRLRDWQRARTWPAVLELLAERLADGGAIDWERAGGPARRPVDEMQLAV